MFNFTNMSFNAIHETKSLAKISEFTVLNGFVFISSKGESTEGY